MRILVTGYRGRVGKVFTNHPGVFPLDCDVTNRVQIQHAIKYTKPDLVVHLASKNDVDFCEKPENEKLVILTNTRGTFYVAEEVERYGCGMVMVSTDHVFSGKRWMGKYKENDTPKPINFYGLTKFAAEGFRNHFKNFKVVRTSTLFNPERIYKEVKTMEEIKYPMFFRRSFLHINHFCKLLYDYCQRFGDMPLMLHLAGVDSVSYYELMCQLADEWKIEGEVKSRREEVDGFAPRGHNLSLDTSLAIRLGFHRYSYLDGIEMMK